MKKVIPDVGLQFFSSHGEDAVFYGILKRLTWLTGKNFFNPSTYIEVGSHNPEAGNNTFALYQLGWRGTLVEPNGHWIPISKSSRPRDNLIQCAVSGTRGEKIFYRFSDVASSNTLDPDFASRIASAQNVKVTSTETVVSLTLSDVMENHIEVFSEVPSLLSIDTEGLDLEIVQSYDWKLRPRFVMIEDPAFDGIYRSGDLRRHMEAVGYRPISHILITSIYVDSSSPESDTLTRMGPIEIL
jgi:hypothetical protein